MSIASFPLMNMNMNMNDFTNTNTFMNTFMNIFTNDNVSYELIEIKLNKQLVQIVIYNYYLVVVCVICMFFLVIVYILCKKSNTKTNDVEQSIEELRAMIFMISNETNERDDILKQMIEDAKQPVILIEESLSTMTTTMNNKFISVKKSLKSLQKAVYGKKTILKNTCPPRRSERIANQLKNNCPPRRSERIANQTK